MISETARPETPAGGRGRRWTRWAIRLARLLPVLGVLALLALLLATIAAPSLSGYRTYVIYGSSMEPTIKLGSLIVAKSVSVDDLEVGDIITFRSHGNETTITHRIAAIRHEDGQHYFKTKGDASNRADPVEIQLEDGVRQVAYHLPYLGYVVDFAKGPLGIILLIALPAIGLLALHLTGGEKPATKTGAAYDSGWISSHPPSGPRRRLPAPPLLPLVGGGLIALLVGIALLVVWLTDSDGNSPEEAASNAVPNATAAPSATPPATTPSLPRLAAPVPESQGALFRLAFWDGNEWQFNLTPGGPVYREGEAVPFLLRIDRALPATAYTLTIQYDCRGFDFLTAYDRDAGSEPALATGGPGSPIADSVAPIPDDPATAADDQEAGSFSLWGGPFTRVDAPLPSAACTGEKRLTVGLSAVADTVFLMWAAQLSDEASNADVPLHLAVQTPGGGELSVEIAR